MTNKTHSYELNQSSNAGWKHRHPGVQPAFFYKLEAPTDIEDAEYKLGIHQHSLDDFSMQVEITNLELRDMYDENGDVLPYLAEKEDEMIQRKKKLLYSTRFHKNAVAAFSYYLRCERKEKALASEKQIKKREEDPTSLHYFHRKHSDSKPYFGKGSGRFTEYR